MNVVWSAKAWSFLQVSEEQLARQGSCRHQTFEWVFDQLGYESGR